MDIAGYRFLFDESGKYAYMKLLEPFRVFPSTTLGFEAASRHAMRLIKAMNALEDATEALCS